ncbi:MAG: TetR/AcrR family transcriptional regulator [Pseudomonadales bacterium]
MSKTKSLTPRQEDRRHRILMVARQMVADYGYGGMVMSEVAERAEVSPTTLYNLYNTKDELLLEALRELMVISYQRVGEMSELGPGWKYLLNVMEYGASLRASEPAYAEAITDALLRAVQGDALTELLLHAVRQDFLFSLTKMAEQGELKKEVDVEHLATILLGNYWSTFMMINKGLEVISRMRIGLLVNVLSVLIASSQGAAKEEMETTLEEIRREVQSNA